MEHARIGNLRILHAVDADGREIESVRPLGVFDLVAPQHHHVIGVGDDLRIKAARLVWLEAIPGGSKSLAVAQRTFEPVIIAAGCPTNRSVLLTIGNLQPCRGP